MAHGPIPDPDFEEITARVVLLRKQAERATAELERLAMALADPEYEAERVAALFEGRVPQSPEVFRRQTVS